MLSLYRALIRSAAADDALSLGAFRLVHAGRGVLAYERHADDKRVLIALNMTDEAQAVRIGEDGLQVLLSTYLDDPAGQIDAGTIHLRANEGLILGVGDDAI